MANVSAVAALPAIPSQIGRYKIVCELGQGGMGTIFLGRAEGIGGFERLMAIKMIHPHLSRQQSFINMFLDEARIAALIRHPNVVPVYEIGEHEGRHFIAMDYVSGEPLSILLDNTWCRGIPLDFDIVAYIISVVCEALHAAHDLIDPTGRPLKVVHRDVCPQNIMLGYDGVTRVMDFGVAKAVDQLSQTRPGTHKGKVPYMAPEAIRCQPIDRRSDIFSLGVVLWESTIGRRLFKAENDILSASKVLKGKVPRPSRARDNYPLELEAIVLKALNPRPEKRFQTAREMGQALREYLAHRASLVSPSDIEALLKQICKHRYEKRLEIERRAAAPIDPGPIDEETIQLFAAGESNLPSFDIEAALRPIDEAMELRSAASPREVYEYEDELDDATVQTQLEEIGYLATAEFDLLEEDRDAPRTVIDPTLQRQVQNDTSAVQQLVKESDAHIRSSSEVIKQLVQEELVGGIDAAKTPIEILPEFVVEPASEPSIEARENTPLLKLDLVGGRRGLLVIAASLAAVALVALGIAASLDDEVPPAVTAPPQSPVAEKVEPVAPPPIPTSVLPVQVEQPRLEQPPPVEAAKPVTPPPPRARAKVETKKKKVDPPAPRAKEEIAVDQPEKPNALPPVVDAVLDESDEELLARRSKPTAKKKKERRERSRAEKKKAKQDEGWFLVGPGDL